MGKKRFLRVGYSAYAYKCLSILIKSLIIRLCNLMVMRCIQMFLGENLPMQPYAIQIKSQSTVSLTTRQ